MRFPPATLILPALFAMLSACVPLESVDDDDDEGKSEAPWGAGEEETGDGGSSDAETGTPGGGDTDGGSTGDGTEGTGTDGGSGGSSDGGTEGAEPDGVTYTDWCDRWKECGGTYYETAEDCVDATYAYFGDCAEMLDALDAYAVCMVDISCDDFDPDTYDPADTDCWREWDEILSIDC